MGVMYQHTSILGKAGLRVPMVAGAAQLGQGDVMG